MSLTLVRDKISQLKKKIYAFIFLRGGLHILLILFSIALLSFLADFFLQFPLLVRQILFLSYLGFLCYAVYQHLWVPFSTPISDEDVAIAIEKENPALKDRLISALQFSRLLDDPEYHDSPVLTRQVIGEVEKISQEIKFSKIIDFSKLLRAFVIPILLFSSIQAGKSYSPKLYKVWMDRNLYMRDISWPRSTNLFLIKQDFFVEKNQAIKIEFSSPFRSEDAQNLLLMSKTEAGILWKKNKVQVQDSKILVNLDSIKENTYFYLKSEQFSSDIYLLRLANFEKNEDSLKNKIELTLPDPSFIKSRGERLTIRVFAVGKTPSIVSLFYKTEEEEEWTEEPMGRQGENTFKFTFQTLTKKILFFIVGGDDNDKKPVYQIEVLNPPTIENIALWHSYPEYTQKPSTPKDEPLKDGNIKALEGSKVKIKISTNISITKGKIVFSEKHQTILKDIPLKKITPQVLEADLEAKMDTRYTITLEGENGLSDPNPSNYYIRVQKDQAPYIKRIAPKSNYQNMLATGALPLEYLVSDDYGLSKSTLLYKVNRSENWEKLSLPLGPQEKTEDALRALAKGKIVLSSLKIRDTIEGQESAKERSLQEGDTLYFKFRVEDNNNISGPGIKETDSLSIEIVSKTDLLRKLNEKLLMIKQDLSKIAEEQRDKKDYLDLFVAEQSKVEIGDLAQILNLHFTQRSITRDTYQVAEDVREVLNIAENNEVWDIYTKDRVENVQNLLLSISNKTSQGEDSGLSEGVEKKLIQAYQVLRQEEKKGRKLLQQSVEEQEKILFQMQEAIRLLGQWEDFNEIVKDLEKILDKSKTQLMPMLEKSINK